MILFPVFYTHNSFSDEASRLDAVTRFVSFSRDVEAVCQPYYRAESPIPFRRVPDLPIVYRWARSAERGVHYINYGGLLGSVEGDRITVSFGKVSSMPEGARRWNYDEYVQSARKIARWLTPAEFGLGESFSPEEGRRSNLIQTDVVLREDPRLRVGRLDFSIDSATGLPTRVQRTGVSWPKAAPERLRSLVTESVVEAEALRVFRGLPSFPPARLGRCQFVYQVPDFRDVTNEMTSAHFENVAHREAIPLYQWIVGGASNGEFRMRVVWIDARTGKGVAARETRYPYAGNTAFATVVTPTASRWRLGKVEGSFDRVSGASFDGFPVVVSNEKREVLTLRFDAKLGLVRDGSGTYRPDDALLKAMRAQGLVKPFGKPATGK